MPDLLLELFSEEIPARMQARAAEDLKRLVTEGLIEAGLTYASAGAFATPRRLALSVEGLSAASPDLREERKGPRADAPEKAIEGFLRSTGLTRGDLELRADKKGDVLYALIEKKGRPAADIIAELVPATIRNFPWPKSMRWGSGSLRWVRPLQSILCILSDEAGSEVVPFEVGGLKSGAQSEGHRFLGAGRFEVSGFDEYAAKLRRAHVILSAEERAEIIRADAETAAFAQGLELVEDTGLLAEVAGLVEWPVVLMGEIGEEFLSLPPEVLQTSMKEHQKFFSVRNPKTGRIERYITVANIEAKDGGKLILAGNSKVLAARLSDAKFFWENDLRIARAGMSPWQDSLAKVTFHNKLGSLGDRVARMAELAAGIAPKLGADPAQASHAARLAKADLASEMVYEFPELQGLMGRYYLEAAGEPAEVAAVAAAHYAPLGPSDDVPTEPLSMAVALAEKLDLLAGFWAIDEKPTGSKDPFALRRAALGVIRTVLENGLRLRLAPYLERANEAHGGAGDMVDLMGFLAERLKVYLRSEGIRHDVIDACFALGGQDDLVLLTSRLRALQDFLGTDDGANLLAGTKRATNILAAEEKKDGVEYSLDPEPGLAAEGAEAALFAALDTAEGQIEPALKAEDFGAAMAAMAALRPAIDAFFEDVQVNAPEAMIRRNRLCLLNRIRVVTGRIAHFSALEG